jgi:hypothetical protein
MRIRVEDLGEPELEFGHRISGRDPKAMLPEGGPLGSSTETGVQTIRLGLLPAE